MRSQTTTASSIFRRACRRVRSAASCPRGRPAPRPPKRKKIRAIRPTRRTSSRACRRSALAPPLRQRRRGWLRAVSWRPTTTQCLHPHHQRLLRRRPRQRPSRRRRRPHRSLRGCHRPRRLQRVTVGFVGEMLGTARARETCQPHPNTISMHLCTALVMSPLIRMQTCMPVFVWFHLLTQSLAELCECCLCTTPLALGPALNSDP